MSGAALPRIELAPGYTICRLIHGGWQLSAGHRAAGADRQGLLVEMERAVDAGATTFDGADIYTGVEELYGDLIRRCGRDRVQVHTKFVPDLEALPSITRDYVERIIDRSLRRLGVDSIDLVQYHWWDFDVPGHVEVAGWLDELRRAGKIRHLGVTNFDRARLQELLEAGLPVISNQVQYSLLDRRPEVGAEPSLVELCQGHGISLLCYGTLAGGLLTGRWRGARDPGYEELPNRSLLKYRLVVDELGGEDAGWRRFQSLLDALVEVAAKQGVDVAAVATGWTLAQPAVAAAIVGWSGFERFERNRRALEVELDESDRARIDGVLAEFSGPRGAVYALERDREGRHGSVMRYDLNRSAEDAVR